MTLWILFLFPILSFAAVKPEGFIIQIHDRSMVVLSPDSKKNLYSVIVENQSLSDQVGKFIVKGKILKFVSVKSGKSESVEFENSTGAQVVFIPISPSFQEVPLIFGKKAYEIPSKK